MRKPAQKRATLKTLERVFSKAGVGSRTEARSWIGAGRVKVNGQTVQNADHWVDLAKDRITLDGKPLRSAAKRHLVLYKPKGYVTTRHDPEGRPTVFDLLAEVQEWLVPVGRLDLDSSGLLLLTNDTDFAESISNPIRKVPKVYQVKANQLLSEAQLQNLRAGVELHDGPTRPAEVRRLRDHGKYTHFEIVLTEGRNRQVRRMLEAVGAKVLKLVRVAIGDLRIGKLEIGTWRDLTAAEVRSLNPRTPQPGSSTSYTSGRR